VENHPLFSQAIEVWRLNDGMAVEGQRWGSHLIGHND
jgi:hypothetical protein